MQCLNPIHIVNPTKDFRLNDPLTFEVPCGFCYNCNKRKKSDMYIRIYKQMLYNNDHDINNYFFTLTYNNAHLPYLEFPLPVKDENGDQVKKRINAFDREKWRLFMQNLIKTLRRRFRVGVTVPITDKDGNLLPIKPPVNYLCASELGSERGRSHHHVHLGVHKSVPAMELFDLVQKLWNAEVALYDKPVEFDIDGVKKAFHLGDVLVDEYDEPVLKGNGYVFPKEVHGGISRGRQQKPFQIEDTSAAARYVSKYIQKDMFFYGDEDFINYRMFLKQGIQHEDLTFSDYCKQLYDSLRRYLPFTSISQNYGACIIEELTAKTAKETAENIIRGVSMPTQKGNQYFPTPMYIQRKMLYDIAYVYTDAYGKEVEKPYVRYDLNTVGHAFKVCYYDDKLKLVESRLRNTYVLGRFNDQEIKDNKEVFKDIDFHLLAIYKLTFQNRLCPVITNNRFSLGFDTQMYEFDLDNKAHYEAMASQYAVLESKPKRFGIQVSHDVVRDIQEMTFNNLPIFYRFDLVLDLLERSELRRLKINADQGKEKEKKQSTIKHNYNDQS